MSTSRLLLNIFLIIVGTQLFSACSDSKVESVNDDALVDENGKGKNSNAKGKNGSEPGDGEEPGGSGYLAEEEFEEDDKKSYGMDIIFLVDTSGSMALHTGNIRDMLSPLVTEFIEENAEYDLQVLVTGEDFELDVSSDKVGMINQYVGSHGALSAAQNVISGQWKSTNLESRPAAVKEIVVVTNDDSDSSIEEFHGWMTDNPDIAANVHVNGIVGFFPSTIIDPCYIEHTASVYIGLAQNPLTKGYSQNLCGDDWTPLFASLKQKLEGFRPENGFAFNLKKTPSENDLAQVEVLVNGTELDSTVWKYDASINAIIIFRQIEKGDKIKIRW